MTLLIIAFVAGLLTVLAPCTLPLLPVIIGGSVTGKSNAWRALVIAVSLGASVFLFTLLLKASTIFINVPQEFWNVFSGGLLIVFGLVTLFPALWDRFALAQKLNLSSNRMLAQGYTRQSFIGDVIVGASLGPVFSSCSPTYFIVLATVLPVHPAQGVVYLFAYAIGLIISLLSISLIGQRIVAVLGIAANPNGWFKRLVGLLFLVIGVIIASGWSTSIEAGILSHAGAFDVTKVEQVLLSAQDHTSLPVGASGASTTPALSSASPSATSTPAAGTKENVLTATEKALMYPKAPELVSPDAYLNTDGQPITISQFKGKKVVLIDFWTYSCINCLRTLPYLKSWYDKYKDQGLVIIGVHTPEFAFEHVQSNVEDALKRLGVTYPVVLDNEYKTWSAFDNEYWPREYLIDIDGYIVHDHAGEGDYDETEKAIQAALKERADRLSATSTVTSIPITQEKSVDFTQVQSPETYFGSNRNQYLGNGAPGLSGVQSFAAPASTQPNTLYLGGSWNILPEYAETQGTSDTITYTYSAHDVYFVASAPQGATITVLRDGVPAGSYAGADIDSKTSSGSIRDDRLYHLIHDPGAGVHTIEIKVTGGTLDAYTFTFG